MDQNLVEVCFEESLVIPPSSGSNVTSTDSLVYVLHTSIGMVISDILAVSDVGEFSFNPLLMDYNTIYYVSAVVYAGGIFSAGVLNEECTLSSMGTPVVWLLENRVELPGSLEFCRDEEIEVTICYFGLVPMILTVEDGIGNAYELTFIEEGKTTFNIDMSESSVFAVAGFSGVSCPLDVIGTLEIKLKNPPQVEIVPDVTICNSSITGSIIILEDLIVSSNTEGSWYDPNGNLVSGTIDFDGFSSGIYIYEYTTSGNDPCDENTYNISIKVEDCNCPMDIFLPFDGLCQGNYSFDLNDYLNTNFIGLGSWEVSTIFGAGMIGLQESEITITASNVGVYLVTFTFDELPQGCEAQFSFEFEVSPLFSPGDLIVDSIEICIDDQLEIILFDYLENYDEEGAWVSQQGLSVDAMTGFVDLSSVGSGTFIFEYRIPENEHCPSLARSISILIFDPVELVYSVSDPICFGLNDGIIGVEDGEGQKVEFTLFNNSKEVISNPDSLFAGDYEVVVIDEHGCVIVENFSLIDPLELFLDLGDDRIVKEGDVTTISPVINFDNISLFQWFANQAVLNIPTFDTLLISPDDETLVQLIIEDHDGCIVADDLLLSVLSENTPVVLANIFNPKSNTFGIEEFNEITLVNRFFIIDRWGSLIYDAKEFLPSDISKRWDGTFNGSLVEGGVYVYGIHYTNQKGTLITIYGDVAVIR